MSKLQLKKAIIPVAGWGTRRLPITKTIEKAMLPIGNRPLVDYIVQDCVKAGIEEIFIVTQAENSQVEAYYSPNPELENYLESNQKTAQLEELRAQMPDVKFHFVVQPKDGRYGTAIPVAAVARQFGLVESGEPVAILMGDDFLWNQDGASELEYLSEQLAESSGAEAALLGVPVEKSEVTRYGVLDFDDQNNFRQIVEKPSVEAAPSNLINVSKYIFSPELVKLTVEYVDGNPDLDGEYMITEPINQLVKNGGKIKVVPARGQYLDGGSVEGWLHANRVVLSDGE